MVLKSVSDSCVKDDVHNEGASHQQATSDHHLKATLHPLATNDEQYEHSVQIWQQSQNQQRN